MSKKTKQREALATALVEDTLYKVVEVDTLQWGIQQGNNVISFHMFSDSLARRWKELTRKDLDLDLPRRKNLT